MSIKQFEVFHGIVLTKLLRSKKPVSLRMVETRPDSDDWRVYTINIDSDLFVKHRITYKPPGKKGRYSWQFVFSQNEIFRINEKDKTMYIALVCGRQNIKEEIDIMEVCFLEPKKIANIFPSIIDKPFSLTVRSEPNKSLRIIVNRKVRDIIPVSAIENWDIPGS